jgi:hypothetical protein
VPALLCSQDKVIGGKEIGIADAPWMANVRVVNTAGVKLFDRSAIFISENLVLTASHNWPDVDCSCLAVHAGGASDGTGRYYSVHRFIHHPDKDITLLELSSPVDFNENIRPIDYVSCADESLYAPGTDATIYGWGRTVPDAPPQSLKLRAAGVKIISCEEANRIFGAPVVSSNTIVSVGGHGLHMGGKGDSGGALAVLDSRKNHILAGVTILADTRGIAQNSGLTAYAPVKPVVEWIDSNKCMIAGADTVPSSGAVFEIVNMPHGTELVEWKYSGLTGMDSTASSISVVPSVTDREVNGYLSATVTTGQGTLTVRRKLVIMPRVDISISVAYNRAASRYEMTARTVNMEAIDDMDMLECRNIDDDVKLMGFVWNYNGNIDMGQEAVFEINPNPPVTHTVSVSRYDCNRTLRLDKTFFIQHAHNEFVTVYNEPGMITLGDTYMYVDFDASQKLQMTHLANAVESSMMLSTSPVTVTGMDEKIPCTGNLKVFVYSRTGKLLYTGRFDSSKESLRINTASFGSDVLILRVHNMDTGNVTSSTLIN